MKTRLFLALVSVCAMLLVPGPGISSAAVAASPPSPQMPGFIRHWYGIDQLPYNGSGQTIAVIGTGNYTGAANDLAVEIQSYGLGTMNGLPGTPACTAAEGPHPCFQRVQAPPAGNNAPLYFSGGTAYQREAAADIQWAHVIAPGADILFVDSASAQPDDYLAGVDLAVNSGASVVTMSFGWQQTSADMARESHFANKPGVVFLAGSGDYYYQGNVLYPAASAYVLSVGGTTLSMSPTTGAWSEIAWGRWIDSAQTKSIGSGGGLSQFTAQPAFQQGFQPSGQRAVPDVAYAADWVGFPTYVNGKFVSFGGTSLGTPQWAGIVALANQARAQAGKANLQGVDPFYAAASGANYRDMTVGYGACMNASCQATDGYDMATGLGVPQANNLVPALAAQ